MITVDEAVKLLRDKARDLGTETVPLEKALGRVLAGNVHADRDYPPFNRATMDGYALSYQEWETGARKFRVEEIVFPGIDISRPPQAGSCYQILTGAAVPPGLDMIIRKEDSILSIEEMAVSFPDLEVKRGQNIALRGKDLAAGDRVYGLVKRLGPVEISVLAALGKYELIVNRQPSVAVFTTGNEVKAQGEEVLAVEIRNSNLFLLKALLEKWSIYPSEVAHIQDTQFAVEKALKAGLKYDVIIFNGAVSAGESDFVPEVLTEAGMTVIFQQVAMRPGRPVLFGIFKNGPVVFALPGNPLSCLVTFQIFVDDFLRCCVKLPQKPARVVQLDSARVKDHRLTEFFPVQLGGPGSGASIVPFNGSGDIRACLTATGLAVQESDVFSLDAGSSVTYYPFDPN